MKLRVKIRRGFGYKITLVIHHLKHQKVMNKTVKKILQVISYIISILLGAAGGSMM
jgi:hypothetical protein